MPFAVGVLRINPLDLYRMTPGEIISAADGYELEQYRNQELLAWGVANLLIPEVKRSQRKGLFKKLLSSLRGNENKSDNIHDPKNISPDAANALPGMADEMRKTFHENARKRREKKEGAVSG